MKGIAEIIVAKYRSGEPTTAYMGWVNGHFVNISQEDAARKFSENDSEKEKPMSQQWR